MVVEVYWSAFRLDYLNRSAKGYKAVPSYNEVPETQIRKAWQGTDHVRIDNFSKDSEYRESASSLKIGKNSRLSNLPSHVRQYSCKVNTDFSEWDKILDTNVSNYFGQEAGTNIINDLGGLHILKKEIECRAKNLKPQLISEIKKDIWPMLRYSKEVRSLVMLKQKYLALLSSKYNLHSTQVNLQVLSWLSNLDMRIFAIETVYRSPGSKTPGIDNVILNRENLLSFLDILKENYLLKYKTSSVRQVLIPKNTKGVFRPLGIPTIKDRIIQTLFVQVIEPVIDPHADVYSFGYRKRRSAHQAIGELSHLLYIHPYSKRKSDKVQRYFSHSKYILQVEIKGFFDNVDHEFILNQYPMPKKYKGILESWLKAPISYQNKEMELDNDFPQGSVIGPSLANFTLNGLERFIVPTQITAFDQEKSDFLANRGQNYKRGQSKVRKTLSNRIIRFVDDFIIISNDQKEIFKVKENLKKFLDLRGLEINEEKSELMKWKNGTKFNYLGFTFHYINNAYPSKVTEQKKGIKSSLRVGLYVYPVNEKVQDFKRKIKNILVKNLNWSPYRIIETVNPIIRGWASYYGIGTLRQFSRLDHFIHYRTWRYLRRKYKKVTVSKLLERYYQGIPTPTGRSWQFHGIWNEASTNLILKKGKISWLILLCKVLKPMPAHMFRASSSVLKTSVYIDSQLYEKWAADLIARRNSGKSSNNWSELYKKQRGICTECGQSLGYLLTESLEIHHIKQISKSDLKDPVNCLTNLKLIHKTCHRSIPVSK
uniref:putative reverse transcriptase protein n=1 Tax=Erythrolobus coxiae TaxID=362235 RepID=UPI001FCCC752|nr:putative reverse transcriptase protein [Erythrolobus coxiae]UNJ19014.1 putative reverse transcriptase protein [Erythrolobus coxiae]